MAASPTIDSSIASPVAHDRALLARAEFCRALHADATAQLALAEAAYQRVVDLVPGHFDAGRRLVEIALAHGDLEATDRALAALRAHHREDPRILVWSGEYHALAGDTLIAIEELRAALSLAPSRADAGLMLAVLLTRTNDAAGAIDQLTRTAQLNPAAHAVRAELGRLLTLATHTVAAAPHLEAARRLRAEEDADRAPIMRLLNAREFDAAEAALVQRRTRDPRDVNAIALHALLLERRRDPERAAFWFSRAHDLDPGQPAVAIRWAFRLSTLGASEAARVVLERVLLRVPDFAAARIQSVIAIPPIPPDIATIERSRQTLALGLRGLRARPTRFGPEALPMMSVNFWMAYQGGDDRALQVELAAHYRESCAALNYVAPHVGRRSTREKLRVGLLSAFFSDHVMSRMYRRLIAGLDRRRYEVVVIHSTECKRDAVTGEIDGLADAAVYLPHPLEACQRDLAALELDVLFFPDVGMSHDNYFLAFGRYARVQCTSWGHPVTTGISTIDYFLSSRRLEREDADAHYSEQLVRFADLPSRFDRPSAVVPVARERLGLPADARLYGCLQSLFKFHPSFDAAIAGILRADPKAIVLTIGDQHGTWSNRLRDRWKRAMPNAVDRIVTAPRLSSTDFLCVLAGCDVAIDTFPFAGGNTSIEALGVGTPLITLPTQFMRGRCGLGTYDQIGFHDLVARDPDHYIELALRTANDRDFRARSVEAIRDGAANLFEHSRVIEEFNEFFATAYANTP